MSETRLVKLGKQVLTCMEWHDNEAIRQARLDRLVEVMDAFREELRHTECPRCNQRDVALTEMAIGYRSGQLDRTERVCGLCLAEIRADRNHVSAIYTKR